jgi:hypothetical protein
LLRLEQPLNALLPNKYQWLVTFNKLPIELIDDAMETVFTVNNLAQALSLIFWTSSRIFTATIPASHLKQFTLFGDPLKMSLILAVPKKFLYKI